MDRKSIRNYKLCIFVLIAFTILLSNAGCTSTGSNDKTSVKNEAPASQKPDEDKAATGDEKTKDNNPAANKSQEVECDWTLTVNDTVSTKVNGYDFKCTLSVNVTKIGGKNDIGIYGGTVKLSYEYKMQSQGVTGNAVGSGQDLNSVITVVPYEVDKFSDFGVKSGNSPLAPLIEYDTMALGNFNLTGNGISKESARGAEWSKQESKTISVPYKIAIDGGQAALELPSIAPDIKFKGVLTGTPR